LAKAPLPKLTEQLLRDYSGAALRNAEELLAEATLLRDHDHNARAYFLSVSCIEEVGKALQAHDSQNRNLADPALCARLITGLENHAHKINYALSMWALNSSDPRGGLRVAIDLVIQLKYGREPSMYCDLRSDPDRAQTPKDVVRAKAAQDCVRLATNCLAFAKRHLLEKLPAKFTPEQDRMFTMKSGKFQEMLKREDFWWFYIARMENGQNDLAEAVLTYERNHLATSKAFVSPA
jgi:AbiV family abortive infection protein